MAAANLWGELGLSYENFIYPVDAANTSWGYTFIDVSPNPQNKQLRYTTREVTSTAECKEYKVISGGYADFNLAPDDFENRNAVLYEDFDGVTQSLSAENVAIGATSWIGNITSVVNSTCGLRCAQILALQSANNCTQEQTEDAKDDCFGANPVPDPRLWTCTNVMSQVSNTNSSTEGFKNPDDLALPDLEARIIAGGPGWSGVELVGSGLMQAVIFRGDNIMNAKGSAGAEGMAQLVMQFSSGVLAAYDLSGGPRQNLTGAQSPGPAQVVKVKWNYSILILAGIPGVQFLMLLGVVWFSGKAVILEPSYMAAAHLLQPMLNKVGEKGPLLSVDEMADRLGDYKIAYGVRPDQNDPGHSDTTFVRDLDIIEEREGFGYIRGKMPEGRYD